MKHLPWLALLALACIAGPAAAHVVSITQIADMAHCPGISGNPLSTIVPQLSTRPDDLGQPWQVTLTLQDWSARSKEAAPNVLAVCAVSPEGVFLGGSTVTYTPGSRLTLHQSSGTEGLSLERIVSATTSSLANRDFQLYVWARSYSNAVVQLEVGQSGNNGQFVTSALAPSRTLQFFAMSDSNKSPFLATYYLASYSPGICHANLLFVDDAGMPIGEVRSIGIPARGRVAVDPELPKGISYSGVIFHRGDCEALSGMRLVTFPSSAAGGRSGQLTTSRYYEGDGG